MQETLKDIRRIMGNEKGNRVIKIKGDIKNGKNFL